MVARFLITLLLVAALPAWGGGGRQLCLSCHPAHYAERGRCSDCHHGNSLSERKNIAHSGLRAGKYVRFTLGSGAQLAEGQRLLDQLGCRRCHESAGRGNPLAVSLDGAAARKSAGELVQSIRRPVANMPNFALDEERVATLLNAVFAGARGRETAAAAPVRVHFAGSVKNGPDLFTTKCGSCHRLLSERLGGGGRGDVAPNLSGLFSGFYPGVFKNGETWNPQNLGVWLKNPRDVRQWARMQPVTVTGAELKQLCAILTVSPGLDK